MPAGQVARRQSALATARGARVITCVIHVHKRVELLTIYDKSEQGSITRKELDALVNEMRP